MMSVTESQMMIMSLSTTLHQWCFSVVFIFNFRYISSSFSNVSIVAFEPVNAKLAGFWSVRIEVLCQNIFIGGKGQSTLQEMFEENGNKFVLKIWCKISVKYKQEILSPLKGSAKSAIVTFIGGMDKVISIFQF